MKKLIGSVTSPYVRRIRLMLEDEDYEFEETTTWTDEGRALVNQYSPAARIPILVDGDQVIWDSFLIASYLNGDAFPLGVQKDLVLINELTDAGVQIFQVRKFIPDSDEENLFSKKHSLRMGKILDYFELYDFSEWSILSQWLYCTLDWFTFRSIYPWQEGHPKLVSFYKEHKDSAALQATAPR